MKKRFSKFLALALAMIMIVTAMPVTGAARGDSNASKYPSQTISAETGDGITVTVKAPKGALPAKTTMNVARVRDISSVQSAVNTAGYDGDVRLAVDITFMNNGKEIQPEKSVKVAVESYELSGVRDLSVVHLDADAEGVRSGVAVEQIGGAKLKGSSVSFSARHFSIYAIIGDSSEPAMTVNFFGENLSKPIYSIRVTQAMIGHLDDYIVVDPEVVTSSSIGHDKVFCGWTMRSNYTVENITGAAARDYNIENVRAAVNRVLNNNFVDGNTISVYAMLFYEYSVRFFGEPKNVNGSNVVPVYEVKTVYSRERASASNKIGVKVDLDYPVADRDSNFSGWKITGDSSNTLYKLNDTIQITGDTELTPEVASGHWLTFIENPDGNHKGATYTAPQFYASGERTERPTDPTLAGYHLEGWYENYSNGNYSGKYNFNATLSASKTLYAKWELDATVPYTVIIWRQNVDNDRYAVDADKTYDYYMSVELSAAPNATIASLYQNDADLKYYTQLHTYTYTDSLGETQTSEYGINTKPDNTGTWKSFLGFKFNTTRGAVSVDTAIKPAGTTVINLYWNRELVTVDFANKVYTAATPNWSSSNTYYFKIGDQYYQCYRSNSTTYIYIPVNGISSSYTYYIYSDSSWNDLYYSSSYGRWESDSLNVYFSASSIQSYLNNGKIALRHSIVTSGNYYYVSQHESEIDTSLREHYYIYYRSTYCCVDYATTTTGYTYYWWVKYNNTWTQLSDSYSYDITDYYTLYERYSNTESGYYTGGSSYTVTDTFKGLYGQKLSKYGYVYPTSPRYFIADGSSTFVSTMDVFGDSANDNPTDIYYTILYGRDTTYTAYVYHYLMDTNGQYATAQEDASQRVGTVIGNGMVFRSFQGFSKDKFRIKLPSGVTSYTTGTSYSGDNLVNPVSHTTSTGWTDWFSYGTGVEYTGNERHELTRWNATEGGIEFRYSRNKYNIHYLYGKFVDGDGNAIDAPAGAAGEMHTSADIYYEADIRSYQSSGTGGNYYDPVAAGDFDNAAYIFEGWFADKDCTVPYYFDNPAAGTTGNYKVQKNMPLDGVTVYAKFRQVQYRVFLHPNGGDLPQGQADTFRRPYDSVISEGQQINATRDGWVLAGWYTDPDFEHRFNFETHLVESTVTTDYNQTEITDYENGVGYNSDAENNRYWITKKLDLYAKWIKPLDGVNGIIVRYDADQVGSSADPIDGSRDGVRYYYDPAVYSDGADAIARTASTPVDDDMLFAYWVLVDENGQPILDGQGNEIHYLPGDHFDIDAQNSYAQPSEAPNPSVQAPAKAASSTSNSVSANGASSSKTASASKAASASKSSASKTNDRGPIVPTATNTLLTENFDSMSSIATSYSATGWYAYNAGSGNNWTLNTSSTYANSGSNSAQVKYNLSNAANCYLVSAPFTLSADATALNLSLYESVYSSSYAETFEAFFVKASDVTSAAGVASATKYQAIASASYTNTSYAEKTGSVQNVSALAGQSVRLVIHCTSAANMYYLYIDDITVTETTGGGSSGGSGKVYELVTAAPSDWSGNYVITYGTTTSMYIMKGAAGSSSGTDIESTSYATAYASSGITLDGTKLKNVADDYVFTIAPSGSYYSVKSVSKGSYLGQLNDSDSTLAAYSTLNTTYCRWTPGYGTNASSMYNSNSSYPYLAFNTSSNYFWSGSASGTYANVRLWKEKTSSTPTYTVTAESNNLSYGSVNPASATVSANGSAEFTASPSTGYMVSSVTVSPTGTATATLSGDNNTTVTVSNVTDDCTVTVIFEAVPAYTVTYMANGSEYATATVYSGNTTTLPGNATTPADYEFIGWTTGTVAETTTQPTYYRPGTQSPVITGNTTFYALYSRIEGAGKVYELLTSTPSDWTGNYVITGSQDSSDITLAVMAGLTDGQSYEDDNILTGDVALADTGIVYDSTNNRLSNVADQYVFTVASDSTGYSIRNNDTYTYLQNNGGYLYATNTLGTNTAFTLSRSGNNVVAYNSTDSYGYLAYLNRDGNESLKFFGMWNSAPSSIYFWRENVLGETYYTTNPTATHTVTFVDSDGTTTLGTATVTDGGNVNSSDIPTPTAPNGYAFDGWTIQGGNGSVLTSVQVAALTISDDLTFVAHYTATSSCTVTYKVDGIVEGTDTVNPGGKVTLPSTVENEPSGYTFIGWVQATVASTTTQPTYYQPGAQSPAITGNTTFYALFTHTEQGGGGVVYNRVYQLQNDGRYIIVADSSVTGTTGYAVGNTIIASSGHYLTPVSVTINDTDNTVTATETNLPKVVWVASGNDTDGYTFYNEAVGKYIAYSNDYLIMGDTGLTWVLTSDMWLDNRVDSDQYYYLTYATSNSIQRYTTGGSSNSNLVIRLYSETELDTTYYSTGIQRYTVTFYDHSGLISTQTVAAGAAAEAPADPASYTENGVTYDFAGWDTDFSNVTSNLVVNAQYLEHGESTIDFNTNVVYLKAHYVARARIDVKLDANGLTFVDTATQDAILSALDGWNTEDISRTGSRIDQDRLHINDSVVLPGTALFTQSTVHGYRIVGWNTMPDGSGTEFNFGDTVYVDNLSRTNNSSENVLYAMWEGYSYVYHSSDNEINRILVESTFRDANVTETINLVAMTEAKSEVYHNNHEYGYLYAGYSTTYYGGAKPNSDRALQWASDNYTLTTQNNTEPYDPSRAYVSGLTQWWKSRQMATSSGETIDPEIGDIYYVKQVTDEYLRPRFQYIYDKLNGNKIIKMYALTAIDDKNYSQLGFTIQTVNNPVPTNQIVGSVTFTPYNSDDEPTVTNIDSFPGLDLGWIGYIACDLPTEGGYIKPIAEEDAIYVTPYWITPDGVRVESVFTRAFWCTDGTTEGIGADR